MESLSLTEEVATAEQTLAGRVAEFMSEGQAPGSTPLDTPLRVPDGRDAAVGHRVPISLRSWNR